MIGTEEWFERRRDLILNALFERLPVVERRFRTLRAVDPGRAGTVEQIAGGIDERDLIGRESWNGTGSKLADGGNILWGERGGVAKFHQHAGLRGLTRFSVERILG